MKDDPFRKPSALTTSFLLDACAVAARCHSNGWCAATAGNFSVRTEDSFWISSSGVRKEHLHPQDFIRVRISDGQPPNTELIRPSAETPLHLSIFEHNPSARSVVHAHPPHTVAASLNGEITFEGLEMQKGLGLSTHTEKISLPAVENSQNMDLLANTVQPLVKASQVQILIVRGHGIYAWAGDPWQAFALIEATEQLCYTSPQRPGLG